MSAGNSDIILERMMTLHPKVIDLVLDRAERLLAALGNPERQLPAVIHIAGTNGKGSTQAMMRAGIEGAGKTAHAYTSPHLARFHERIRVAGELISEEYLTEVLDECYVANGEQSITYFEITTCAAFLAFSRQKADYTLLEVGLGGRVDVTNVVDKPALTIITPVSLDHQQFLGETLPEIAGEKAGIIKRGVPCIVGPQEDAALEVIEAKAARLGAPLLVYGQHWHVGVERDRLIYQDETGLLDLPKPALLGAHQVRNAGAAIAGLRALGFDEDACGAAMTDATWPARMQRLKNGPLVQSAPEIELWLDGGHNAAAGEAIGELLGTLPARKTYLICGMLNTKDVNGYMRPLAQHAEHLIGVSIPGEKNTLPAETTAKAAQDAGLNSSVASSVQKALDEIAAMAPEARVLICGSLYLAGDVLRSNG
ncbi:MAG: folylpolyglutamate synthase/dihydrofolate synthase family protein [Planktotalea sp.]|uniref:bifunctional folylpolyglutamate synthase/dihydrofolate synthase n=1 Tax=Planktotalea sp. TaxID=2029877 RepID=UPI003C726D91